MDAKLVLLPGDGIGPEITAAAQAVLDAVATKFGHQFSWSSHLIGGIAIDETGAALPADTLAACQQADAILLGAVGGPKWDDPKASVRPEQGLLGLRKELGLFANLRPVKPLPGLEGASPLKQDRLNGVDILFVRELTGGIYFGEPRLKEQTDRGRRSLDTMVYEDWEVRRIVKLACELARGRSGRVESIDKANVLESMRLWRQVAGEVAAEHSDITLRHGLVDSAAMRLITAPAEFDVIVSGNMFGDILSDEGAVLTGSLGVLPSASLAEGNRGLYEPIHGSAPDIAGKGIANPLGTILSGAMLLRHSLKLEQEARAVESAVESAIAAGARTRDLLAGDSAMSTSAMTDEVISRIVTPT